MPAGPVCFFVGAPRPTGPFVEFVFELCVAALDAFERGVRLLRPAGPPAQFAFDFGQGLLRAPQRLSAEHGAVGGGAGLGAVEAAGGLRFAACGRGRLHEPVVGLHHFAWIARLEFRQALADRFDALRVGSQVRHRGCQRLRIGLDQPAGHVRVDAFREAAPAGRDDGHLQHLKLRQEETEGFRHDGQQARQVRSDPSQEVRQLGAVVLENDRHARAAEEILAVLAGAQQIDVRVLPQPRQGLPEQLFALAGLNAAGNHQAQLAVGAVSGRHAGTRIQRRQAVGDDADLRPGGPRVQRPKQRHDRPARRHDGDRVFSEVGEVRVPDIPPGRGAVVFEFQFAAVLGQRALQVDSGLPQIRFRVYAEQRPDREKIMQHLQRRQARAQGVQAVPDQRGDDDAPHAEAGQDGPEGGLVSFVAARRGRDGGLQVPLGNGKAEFVAEVKAKALAGAGAGLDFLRAQLEVVAGVVVGDESLGPEADAAAPAVGDVQRDVPAFRAGHSKFRSARAEPLLQGGTQLPPGGRARRLAGRQPRGREGTRARVMDEQVLQQEERYARPGGPGRGPVAGIGELPERRGRQRQQVPWPGRQGMQGGTAHDLHGSGHGAPARRGPAGQSRKRVVFSFGVAEGGQRERLTGLAHEAVQALDLVAARAQPSPQQ